MEQAEKFIIKMAEEVSTRLNAISMRGQYLTLKVLKRHPDAPIEPPKVCNVKFVLAYKLTYRSFLDAAIVRLTQNHLPLRVRAAVRPPIAR